MLLRVSLLWIFGLVTIVPLALYRLFFNAERDEYAFLITIGLFWVFGFWSVVGPLITAVKIRSVFLALEKAPSEEEFRRTLLAPESRELAIDVIASENHLPKFFVRMVFTRLLVKFLEKSDREAEVASGSDGSDRSDRSVGSA